jgi:hypothetical protein
MNQILTGLPGSVQMPLSWSVEQVLSSITNLPTHPPRIHLYVLLRHSLSSCSSASACLVYRQQEVQGSTGGKHLLPHTSD